MITKHCDVHPSYLGVRQPQTACLVCWAIYRKVQGIIGRGVTLPVEEKLSPYWAVFNSTRSDVRLGYQAVRAKHGEAGVAALRKARKDGDMAVFSDKPTRALRLYVRTVTAAVNARRRRQR